MRKNKLFAVLLWTGFLLILSFVVLFGKKLFGERALAFELFLFAFLACLPMLFHFERGKTDVRRIMLPAVMTALSVVGRLLFAALPSFKPVAAMVILSGMWLGSESGFMTGALTAVISNFWFGQGPWTPFQMLTWGIIGAVSGIGSGILKKNRFLLCLFGGLSGLFYSLVMDIYTTVWAAGQFEWSVYCASVASSLPYTAVYIVSNILFLFLLGAPFGRKLERILVKYGLEVQ